jgi:hypothetical protein
MLQWQNNTNAGIHVVSLLNLKVKSMEENHAFLSTSFVMCTPYFILAEQF